MYSKWDAGLTLKKVWTARAESPMKHLARGKRSGTPGMWNKNTISTLWKGKSVKTSKHVIILELYEIEYNDEYLFKD